MAPNKSNTNKRKRTSSSATPDALNKRPRTYTKSRPESYKNTTDFSDQEGEEYFAAKNILDERAGKYLIEWEGTDPNTGKSYEPTWEPKSNATPALIAEWKARKAASKTAVQETLNQGVTPRVRRKSRVIQSSEPSTQASTVPTEVSPNTSPVTELRPPARLAAHVQIDPRGSSLNIDEFERFSQIAASSAQSQIHLTRQIQYGGNSPLFCSPFGSEEVRSSQPFEPSRQFVSSGVVPDSQTSDGSVSYSPTTQEVSGGSNQNHSPDTVENTNEKTEEESTFIESEVATTSSIFTAPVPDFDPIVSAATPSQLQRQTSNQVTQLGNIEFPECSSQNVGPESIEIPESPSQQEPKSLEQLPTKGLKTIEQSSQPQTAGRPLEKYQSELSVEQGVVLASVLEHPSSSHTASENFQRRVTTPVREHREPAVPESIVQANRALQDITQHDNIDRPNSASDSRIDHTNTSTNSDKIANTSTSLSRNQLIQQEQHAQVVHPDPYLSTQDELEGSVRPTTEVWDYPEANVSTPKSRHDSSQQSPYSSNVPSEVSVEESSPPPRPPPFSIDTFNSIAPSRPRTPLNTSSLSIMAEAAGEPSEVKKAFDRIFEDARKNSPAQVTRRTLQTASPATGTRSPSTIPDQPPPRQEPPSLRTAALMNSSATHIPEAPELILAPTVADTTDAELPDASSGLSQNREQPNIAVNIADNDVDIDDDGDDDDGDDDDDDDDTDEISSVLNDEIKLALEEYTIPLPLEGRQKATYSSEIMNHRDLLARFLEQPQEFEQIDEVEKVYNRLKDIETHVDLCFAESSTQQIGAPTQAQWDLENNVKFRFLGAFLHSLREHELNIIIVLKENHERLFDILETFLKGRFFSYKYPAKGRAANPSEIEGPLTVTLLSSDSDFIVEPPNAIICLDGADATHVRKKTWSLNTNRTIPVFSLIIPRTIGHIELSVFPKLPPTSRLHVIFSIVSQIHRDIGRPLGDTPRPQESAELVANYVIESLEPNSSESVEWPLPSISSIKEVVEYKSSQPSQDLRMPLPQSSASVASSKRPLDDEHLDPAKRVRMTPQPQPQPQPPFSGSVDVEVEVTRISDSMPGTAVDISKVQAQLIETQAELDKIRKMSHANDKRYRELEVIWEKRQFDYEELSMRYRVTMGELEAEKLAKEQAIRTKDSTLLRIDKFRTEVSDLRTQLTEAQNVNLASEDEKIVEVTRWKKEAMDEKTAKERAIKQKDSSESTLEYIKDQMRDAQTQASDWKEQYEKAAAELADLQKKTSGELGAHKKMHYDRTNNIYKKQLEHERMKYANLERQNGRQEEEIQRLRGMQKGYGTRGSSVPRSPRVGAGGPGSRAASPLPNNRDRVSNLRNG